MSRKSNPCLVLLGAAVIVAVFGCLCYAQPAGQPNDEAAIRALVDKINLAWQSEKPSVLFQEVLSDKGFVVVMPKPDNPSEAIVINKQKFCELIDNMMQQGQRPQKHEHKVKSITIIGPLAYEIGDVLDIMADGSQRHSEVMNIFAKEDTGWKLIHSVPVDNIQKTPQSLSSPETEKQVRQTAIEFAELFQFDNRDPFPRLGEILDNNVIAVTSQGQLLQGKDNVLQTYRQSWQQTLSEFQSLNTRYNIRSVKMTDYGAVVFGKIVINGRLKESDKEFKRSVWETLILRRIAGQWLIIQEHSTNAEPAIGGVEKLSTEQTRQLEEGIRGEFSGIGVEIDTDTNGIYIKKVIDGGPADDVELEDGDIITVIDGQSTRGMSTEQAVRLLKGPKGTSVKIKVSSNNGGESRDVTIVRGTVVISGVEKRLLKQDIGLLSITCFTKQTPAAVREAIDYFRGQGIRGLVLDMRGNQGGFYQSVHEVADMFINAGESMWQIQQVGQNQPTVVRAKQPKIAQWPVVVLVDANTRSGGELLASALKTSAGAKLLGQKTYGKGFGSGLKKRPDGTSRKVISTYFFTADGQPIDKQGIQPDRQIAPETPSQDVFEQAVRELSRGS